MVENFWLFAFVAAAFGVEWKFYDWHQPQIEILEQRRWEEIRARITQFLEAQRTGINGLQFEETLHTFVTELSSDKDLIFPVGGALNPHRKIFKCLVIAIILSVMYGAFGVLCLLCAKGNVNFTVADSIQFYVKLGLAAVTFGPIGLGAWLGWTEFQYVLRIKERFAARPSIVRHSEKTLKHGSASPIPKAIEATYISVEKKINDDPLKEIERIATTRLNECVEIVRKAADEPVALYQLRILQKSLAGRKEQISVVKNDRFLLHADPNTEKGPATACWPDETCGGHPLYPAMKQERRGIKVVRIKDAHNRVTAIAFDTLDNWNFIVVAEAHFYEDRQPVVV